MSTELAALRKEVAELKRLIISLPEIISGRPGITAPIIEIDHQEPGPLSGRELSTKELSHEISRGNRRPLHEQNKRRDAALKKQKINKRVSL